MLRFSFSIPSHFIFQVTKSYFNCEKLSLIQLNSEAQYLKNILSSKLIIGWARRMITFILSTNLWETPAKLKMPHLQFIRYYFLSSLAALKSWTLWTLAVLSYCLFFGKRKVSFYKKTEKNPDTKLATNSEIQPVYVCVCIYTLSTWPNSQRNLYTQGKKKNAAQCVTKYTVNLNSN